MAAPRMQVLSIYKSLLRESGKFTSYNFKAYAKRRVRDAFKENKSIKDAEKINNQLEYARDNLNIIKRQVVISQMYLSDKLIIEADSKA